MSRGSKVVLSVLLCALAWAARASSSVDPAAGLGDTGPLTGAERNRLLELFSGTAAADFDVRQQARGRLLAFGPRALLVARQLEDSDDLDTRDFARSFSAEMLKQYRGYLPTAGRLKELLAEQHRVFIGKRESFSEAFHRCARSAGIRAVFDAPPPELTIGSDQTVELQLTTASALRRLLAFAALEAVPRDAAIVIATPARARTLRVQTHDFELAPLSLPPAEAARLAGTLSQWLPEGSEVRAGEVTLQAHASEAGLRMLARALYFLGENARAENFPVGPKEAGTERLFALLARPVPLFAPSAEGVGGALERLRGNGCAVSFVQAPAEPGEKFPRVLLDLREVPLGLCLKWLARRAENSDPQVRRFGFSCETQPPGVTVSSLPESPLECFMPENVGGADVSFLLERPGEKPDAASDTRLRERLAAAFGDEWALYPRQPKECALTVFRGRMLVRGPAPLVSRTLALLANWRASGQAPSAAWRKDLGKLLDADADWDGGATADTVLRQLRDATGLNVLLDRGEDGRLLTLELTGAEAQLLPRGRHAARALLDRLCDLGHIGWTVQDGAIVLSKRKE